jgi:phenylpropionate dioxygenase-like ring-hydroxylating dioxygenase large terminal subunit
MTGFNGNDDGAFQQCWYPVALAAEVKSGTHLGQDFLGTRVIVYRDPEGKPVVQSAWCPHLGADLAAGQMVDGRVRCAFHHWSFAADGRCVAIPTGDKIPQEARIANYPAAEALGLIWAFNGTTPLYPPPSMPGAEDSDLATQTVRYGMRPIDPWVAVSNGVDFQHLRSLHGLRTETPELVEVGPYGLEFTMETPHYRQHGRISGVNCFAQHLTVGPQDMFMMFCGAPIARGRTMAYNTVAVVKGEAEEARLTGVRTMVDRLLAEDAPILSTIRFRKGVLVPSDRHLARFLRYVETFPKAPPPDYAPL